jgi:hypothetical protein
LVKVGALGMGLTVTLNVKVFADCGALTHPVIMGIESIMLYVYVPAGKLEGGVKLDPPFTTVLLLYQTATFVPEFTVKDIGFPAQ